MKLLKRAAGIGLLWTITNNAHAQDFFQVNMKPVRGFMPNVDMLSSPIDHVDPVSRKVHLEIPLASLPQGRGGSGFDLNLVYDTHHFELRPESLPPPPPYDQGDPPWPPAAGYTLDDVWGTNGGWNFNFQNVGVDLEEREFPPEQASCELAPRKYRLSVKLLDGSQHVMHLKGWGPEVTGSPYSGDGFFPINPGGRIYCPLGYMQLATGWLTYFSNDGSYLKLEIWADGSGDWGYQPWHLYLPDGRRIVFGGLQNTHIFDANGNGVHIGNFCADPPTCNEPFYGIVNDAGHEIRISSSPDGLTWTVTRPGPIGPMIWTLNWQTIQLGLDGRQYAMKAPTDSSPWDVIRNLNIAMVTLKYLQLPLAPAVGPDDAPPVWNSYAFGYADDADDGYGELDYVRTPTGAALLYRYELENANVLPSTVIAHMNKVRERRISHDGEPDLVWTYAGGPNDLYTGGYQTGTATVTNPDTSTATYWFGPPAAYLDPSIPNPYGYGHVVYRIDEANGRVTKRLWSANPPRTGSIPGGTTMHAGNQNAFVKRETITFGNQFDMPALTALTDRTIDKNGNLLQTIEYDWVAYDASAPEVGSTIKRRTEFTYYASVPAYSTSTTDDPKSYWNPHFAPLSPTEPRRLDAVRRREVHNEAGTIVAVSEFEYDDPYRLGNLTVTKNWDSVKSATPPGLGGLDGSNSQVLTRSYGAYGNLSEIYEPEVRTHIGYDPSGSFPTLVQYAYGTSAQRSWSYDWNSTAGTLTSKTDTDNNLTTAYTYDVVGRPRIVSEAGMRQTETIYDDGNKKVTVKKDLMTFGDGKIQVTTEYDALGRVVLLRTSEPGNPDGIKVKSTYYPTLNRTVQSSPYRTTADATLEWTCTQKDASQRIKAVAMFKSATEPTDCESTANRTGITHTTYEGNWTSISDPASKNRAESRDALGRLVEVVEDSGALDYHTYYVYDALGNLTRVYQGDHLPRTFDYSSLGRLISAFNPESGTTNYTYTDSGDLHTRTDARPIMATFAYDPLHRILTKSYNDGGATPTVTYAYYLSGAASPKVGQLQSVTSSVASSQNDSYDALGRVTSSSHTITGDSTRSFIYTYWLDNGVKTVTNPSGRFIQYDVDDAGRTARVYAGGTIYADLTVSSTPYTADGRIAQMKLGNNLWETRSYQTPGAPTLFKVGTAQGANDKLELEYNFWESTNNGNLKRHVIRQPGHTWTQNYIYDGVNRLATASEDGGWTRNYGYDRYGNRWVDPSSTSFPYIDSHEPVAVTNFLSNNRISVDGSQFDFAGNQTVYNPWTLGYDAENRNVTVNSPSSGNGTFAYDGDGRRVRKVWTPNGGSSTTTYYLYNALGQLAAEYSTATTTASTSYVHTDMLGSTRMVTNAGGETLECYDYEPFGRMLSSGVNGRNTGCYPPNPDAQITSSLPQKFTGKERDSETRLDYFGARYHSAAQGRFITSDPLEIAGLPREKVVELATDPRNWNKYAYVKNNPLVYVDPTGNFAIVPPTPWTKDIVAARKEYAAAAPGWSKVWAGVKLFMAESSLLPGPAAMSVGGGSMSGAALAKSGRVLEESAQIFAALGPNNERVLEEAAEGVAFRIPDLLGASPTLGEILGEVKNVGKLALTGQMRDAFKAAEGLGLKLNLFVADKTKFTQPLLDQIRISKAKVFRMIGDEWKDVTEELFKD